MIWAEQEEGGVRPMNAKTAIAELVALLTAQEDALGRLGDGAASAPEVREVREVREAHERAVGVLRWTIARLRAYDPDDAVRPLAERRDFKYLRVRYAQARELLQRVAAGSAPGRGAGAIYEETRRRLSEERVPPARALSELMAHARAFLAATSADALEPFVYAVGARVRHVTPAASPGEPDMVATGTVIDRYEEHGEVWYVVHWDRLADGRASVGDSALRLPALDPEPEADDE